MIMRALTLTVLAALAAAPAAAAERGIVKGEFVRAALDEGVACLLQRTPGAVASFLQRAPDSRDAARQAGAFDRGDCMQSATRAMTVAYAPSMYRGAFYKRMYMRDFAAASPVTATQIDFRAVVARSTPEGERDYAVMRQFAACVVQADQETARKMVIAPTGSADEERAFEAMLPRTGLCRIEGRSIEPTKSMLTGLIAEVLFLGAGRPDA